MDRRPTRPRSPPTNPWRAVGRGLLSAQNPECRRPLVMPACLGRRVQRGQQSAAHLPGLLRACACACALLGTFGQMPWIASDELSRRPCRVLVAGSSGSGKSTLARAIAQVLGTDYFEMDALYHGPDWVPEPRFEENVQLRTSSTAWVTEWQYSSVQDQLADRADLLVWLDLSRPVVMRSVVSRTVRRSVLALELWNGNREPPLRTILTDRDHIIRWAWRTHHERAEQINACVAARPHLDAIALRRRSDASAWLTGPLARAAAQS